jgi:nicotinamide-nucleotide adenylyltransferase
MFMRGLFVGRFQPFHNGHVSIVKEAMEQVDELVLVIGSAEISYTQKDPFTAGERVEMILRSMRSMGHGDEISIIPVRDVNRYSIWVDHVTSYTPRIDIVFSNNDLTRMLFKEKGFEVRETPLVDRSLLSGTVIRKRIAGDLGWKELVPEDVYDHIISIDGVKRIKRIMNMGDGS